MNTMTTQTSPSARAMAGATPEFVELCKAMYGDLVDAQEVWEDVIKFAPDQADVNAKGAKLRRNFERGSNALGLTAAGMATGAALRDERLAEGGKVARALHRTGQKIPAPISRISGRKGALLAGGALATQGLNMAGDVAIGQTLSAKPTGRTRKVQKGEVAKMSLPPGIKAMATGIRSAWKPPKPAGVSQPTLPGLQPTKTPNAAAQKAKAVGADVATAASTTTGKVVGGGLAIGGGVKAKNSLKSRSAGVDYAPDVYKADQECEVVFKGTFTEIDEDQRTAFGWASVTELNGQPVVDRQGDYISTDDLEKAAYEYVHKSRVGGDMHRRTASLQGDAAHKVSDMIESVVFTDEKIAKMGLPDSTPRGWWVGYKIHDEETWQLVKKGERTGFSIHGKGMRKAQSIDALMGY